MAALPHTRALIAPSTRLDARAWGQDAHVEVRADDGRVVAHLLLLAPEHAPEQRHVVALLRETYHKTAFLTQAHVSQPGAGVHIDPRLMGARAVSSLPTASPKRPSKLPMLGSMRVGPERVAPAADTSGSGRQASVHERGSPLPQCAGDGANIAQSPLPSRGGNAATAGRDRGVIVHRDVCLVSPAALAARIDLALKAARAVDERASARVFAALAILVLIAIGGVLWAVTSHAPLLRESLLLTLPTLDLALVIMTLWLRDDHTHRSTIHATLVATATAIGITLLCTLLIALASVGARTSPGFSLRVGVADRARDAARAAAAWLAVLALGAALTALAAVALRAASPARRVARLWSSIRLSTSASAVLLFTHELLCAKQRCDEVRPRAEKAVLFASASVLLAIVCPMYAPHARARMRALLLWVVRWERAEADTPLVALLGLHEARFDGRDTARSAAEVMAAAGRAFQVVDLFDLAVALRAGDAEAGSDGLLARASVWERTPPAHTAQRHLASSAACACRGARAWLLQSAERAWARTGAWLPARAPAQAQRRIARTMERLGTAVCDGTTPPTGSRSAQLGSRKRTSARLPAESAGAPLPTASHELSPVLGDGRDPSRRTREQRRISWESCTLAPHGVPGRRHAAREQALDLHQLRAARNARVHNAADAKDSVDFFVVHSHLDSAELKRAALAEWY
ncbi:hypothetical protein KFE25_004875 [Diacronema lutheri]|uniref:Uncharacterized protein n=1 Tax=Diacronema lutheri TaxID=2081491 RepID=A0A8J5XF02_DIALT|nr:hypothetical protein KFE25_004875 [Diacronema lutheri]